MRTFVLILVMLLGSAALARAESNVWVQPFTEANDQQQPDWITRTLRQSLVDELASNDGVLVSTAADKPTDVQFIVTAQIQRVSGELRVTGQIVDAATSRTVGGFKATGSERELFAVQDSIGTQVAKAVAPPPPVQAAQPAVAATTMPSGSPQPRVEAPFAPLRFGFDGSELQDAVRNNRPIQPGPVIVEETQTPYVQPASYGSYYPPYGNGYYGYGWYSPSIIYVGHHHHHGGHHGGGNHGNGGNHGGGVRPTPLPSSNGQAIRAVSGFGGKAPPPGVINTIGK